MSRRIISLSTCCAVVVGCMLWSHISLQAGCSRCCSHMSGRKRVVPQMSFAQQRMQQRRDDQLPTFSYVLTRSGSYKELSRAMKKAGLLDGRVMSHLQDHTHLRPNSLKAVTFLAPRDGAFAQMQPYIYDQLMAGRSLYPDLYAGPRNNRTASKFQNLRDVLLYHMIKGKIYLDDFESGVVETLYGERLRIERPKNGSIILDGHARIVAGDIETQEGVLHTIDNVLLP